MKKLLRAILGCTMALVLGLAACAQDKMPSQGTKPGPSEGDQGETGISSAYEIQDLRVNAMTDPLGIDTVPVFSWVMESDVRGAMQKSYRLTVAESESDLAAGRYVWDTGKVESAASANIRYGGNELEPSAEYWWKVSVENEKGETLESDAVRFETGLLTGGFAGAKWITAYNVTDLLASATAGMNWIWLRRGDAQAAVSAGTQYFRREFTPAAGKQVASAYVAFTADDYGSIYLNGTRVAEQANTANSWATGSLVDVTDLLVEGKNVCVAKVTNADVGYAGFLGRVSVFYTDGSMDTYASDTDWHVSTLANDGCIEPGYVEDASWFSPDQAVPYGTDVWGDRVTFRSISTAAPMLRRKFTLKANIVSARVYATAAGVYDLYINGKRVGDAMLTPGASEFVNRLFYQTYDVTQYVTGGANAIGAMLGNGWYRSGIMHGYTVAEPAFLCKMIVTYSDGSTQTINSDEIWRSSTDGPVLYNDFYNGEDYDATLEQEGWSTSGYDADAWEPVSLTDAAALNVGKVVAEEVGQVRVMDVLDVVEVTEPEEGVYIYDFGQNFAGNVQITVKGERGQKITMRYGEMLNDDSGTGDGPEGTLFTANLRTARATDTYVLSGDAEGETWTPRFTYHGFRYMEITGLDEPLPAEDVKGLVIYSDMEDTATFKSSNPLLNQLASNAYWGQRSNFLSVPTDCPQRDERSAWLGDAQIFVGTASYYMNTKQFYGNFIHSMNDAQHDNGSYTDVAPGGVPSTDGHGGWADAGVIVPYVMYTRYGDVSLLTEYYDNMAVFVDYLVRDAGDDFIRDTQIYYGDWLSVDEMTPTEVTDTAYCVYTCDLMAEIAQLTGHTADVSKFKGYAANFRSSWLYKYMNGDGSMKDGYDTQTAYVLGISFDIIPESQKAQAAENLVDKLEARGYRLTTGFLGVSYLLPALSETGHEDVAFKLLEQEEYPSWLYPVLQGATTIWERWDSYVGGEGFGGAGMNSFNHYSYGSVMEWVFNTVLGIRSEVATPGFTAFTLYPTYGGSLTQASGSYRAQSGLIESGWELSDGQLVYTCRVPANTEATLYLPVTGADASVVEGTSPAAAAEGVTFVGYENGRKVFTLKAGTYTFKTEAVG